MNINIDDLTIREKIGQMFMIGTEKKYMDDSLKKMILQYKIGGIILYKKNYDSYEEMINFINNIKEVNKENKVPLFIAIDQEGGRCNRMPKEFNNLLSATSISKTEDIDLIKKSGEIIGKMLFSSGINMNFAPVLDIKRFPDSHPIGNRCYGENEEKVSEYGVAVMQELQKNSIISVIKHLPGHGATTMDSHVFLPVIKKKIETLEKEDLIPFKKAIDNGAEALMLGHLLVNDINRIFPISLSSEFIKKYLREKYKYNGLIITDDLKMGAIQFIYGPTLATKFAFNAGNDIIINRFHYKSIIRTSDFIVKKVDNDKNLINRIDNSVQRILNLKQKYNCNNNIVTGCDITEINDEIDILNRKCRESREEN